MCAPTKISDKQEKENFHDFLDKYTDKVPKHDMIIIIGNFAKIQEEKPIQSITGRFSLHDNTNDNSLLLAQCVKTHRMVIKITCFPHKNVHKKT
jgi:hypothetical protein